MGRAKLNMELITKEKPRNITFKKRKEGLIRKMHEFTTLCDVGACMIIYGPKQEKGSSPEPEFWPQNLDEVRRIIDIYKSKNKDSGNKTFGLSDFFHDRKRKIEEELAKLRKKNMEAKYPTWLDFMNSLSEPQLREFAVALSNKAEYVKSRIDVLKRNREGLDMNLMDFAHARLSSHHQHHQSHSFYTAPGLIQRGIELEVINQQAISSLRPIHDMQVPLYHQFPSVDHHYHHHHQELHHSVNQNSMMMLMTNENAADQFGGGTSSTGNFQYKRQVVFEASTGRGVVDSMICPKPLRYCEPLPVGPPALPPPYMQAPEYKSI